MILATDLRSGNYVKTMEGGKRKLLHLNAQMIAHIEKGTLIVHPVPLVKEWLLKFQFVFTENAYIHFKFTGSHLEQHSDGFYFFRGKNKLNRFPVIYVHQLQNSFYWMSGEDLALA